MSTILVVYERESEQTAIEDLLATRGHLAVRASNGLEALEVARKEGPAAVISDVLLPKMDGFALCRKLKQDQHLRATPFIFFTTRYDDPKYERFAAEQGADRFLSKVEDPEALLSALDEVLARSEIGTKTLRITPADIARTLERQREQMPTDHSDQERVLARLHQRVGELEGAARRSQTGERRFRTLFEFCPVPAWVLDRDGQRILFTNDAACATFGYSRAEYLGTTFDALRPAADEQVNAAEFSRPGVRRLSRKDGALLDVEIRARDIELDGRPVRLVTTIDTTDRLRAMRALAEREDASRRSLAAAMDGYVLLGPDGTMLELNEAFCRMLRYSREELIGRRIGDFVAGEEQQSRTQRLRALSGGGSQRYEARYTCKDGRIIDVEVSQSALADGADRRVLFCRDVTASKLNEERRDKDERCRVAVLDLLERFDAGESRSDLLPVVAEQACGIGRSLLSYVFDVNARGRTLTLVAWFDQMRGQGGVVHPEPKSLARSGFWAECVNAKRPVMVNDPSPRPQSDGLPEIGRYMAVPVFDEDQVVMVVGVANRESEFSDSDLDIVARYARYAARLLRRREQESAAASGRSRLIAGFEAGIEALARMGAIADVREAEHAQRVSALAVAIARELDLDESRQRVLRRAGLLHDIGMIDVPAEILARPRALDVTELALVHRHPEVGAALLEGIDFGGLVAETVLQHHERMDGSGYPKGLSGEAILLEARILAVADTIVAMCAARPHRPALGIDAALDEINRNAGRLYDPHVVAACTRLFRQRAFELPRVAVG